jgi:hypothetical protein
MPVQTTYTMRPVDSIAGLVSTAQDTIINSYNAEEGLGFGVGVVVGTADNQVKKAITGGKLRGITVFNHSGLNDTVTSIVAGDLLPVLRRGRIYGKVVGAVTAEAPAYVIVAVGLTQGHFTATAGTNLLVGKFHNGGADASLVEIDVNL